MLGLESSVRWRGTDKVERRRLRCRQVYARCLPENALTTGRTAVTLGSACQAQARRAASGARAHDQQRSGPEPGTTMAVTQLAALLH
jgi:hypothetical protein